MGSVTIQDDIDELGEALEDFAYALFTAIGCSWIARKCGRKLRPWAQEAKLRAERKR